ncbi:uncharacterized protein LOC131879036 isoform X4 [Tigriopus californicus]|uniref:uncharacterized protein LOC131879036 isoform X4 n=1 Tax=Tigriopus californicus TaxID=6832 RepID=UPI0027DA61F6|nr:uncharacterized protein LOC131879036 isoform X4 [Tigriopus californicus]
MGCLFFSLCVSSIVNGANSVILWVWIMALVMVVTPATVVKYEVPSQEIYGGRTFQAISFTRESTFLSCISSIQETCLVQVRKALHFDEKSQLCECGQLSRYGESVAGLLVNELPGVIVADTWSISKTDYSQYAPSSAAIKIPLRGSVFDLYHLNTTTQPNLVPVSISADLDFEAQQVAKLSNNLVYQINQTSFLDYSILVWFHAKALAPPHYIWTISESSIQSNTWLVMTSMDTLEVHFRDVETIIFNNVTIKENTWINIGYVFKEGVSKLYLNGVLQGIVPYFGTSLLAPFNADSITLGKSGSTACRCYLTEFDFYLMALNDSMVKAVVQGKVF